jgi:acetyl-CoA carboxylase carboxyltransferase component
MEGDSAVQALYSVELEKYKRSGEALPDELRQAIDATRAGYEQWLDARFAAARGHVDAVIEPKRSREVLSFALRAAMERPRGAPLLLETMGAAPEGGR